MKWVWGWKRGSRKRAQSGQVTKVTQSRSARACATPADLNPLKLGLNSGSKPGLSSVLASLGVGWHWAWCPGTYSVWAQFSFRAYLGYWRESGVITQWPTISDWGLGSTEVITARPHWSVILGTWGQGEEEHGLWKQDYCPHLTNGETGTERLGNRSKIAEPGFRTTLSMSPMAQQVKESTCNVGDTGDMGLISGSGRSLEEGMKTHSSILAWKNPRDGGAWWAIVHGVAESDMTEPLSTRTFLWRVKGWRWLRDAQAPHGFPDHLGHGQVTPGDSNHGMHALLQAPVFPSKDEP